MANLYDDEPAEGEAPPKPGAAPDDEQRENQDNSKTGVLPKEFFGSVDLKPGAEYKVRIEQVMDKEVACSLVSGDTSEKPDAAPEAPPEGAGAPAPGGGMFD